MHLRVRAKTHILSALALIICTALPGCADLRFRGVSDNLLTDMGQQKAKNDCLVYKDQTQYRDCVARVNKDYEELKARQKAEEK